MTRQRSPNGPQIPRGPRLVPPRRADVVRASSLIEAVRCYVAEHGEEPIWTEKRGDLYFLGVRPEIVVEVPVYDTLEAEA